ncbi:MAG TPA: MBL fold metallo-hydrolase [Gemmatimonadales bacterium]
MSHIRFRMVLAVSMCTAGATLDAQQPDWDAVQIQTVPVADGLYILVGRGGNIGLSVGTDGAFVIDDQYAPLTDKILAAIAAVTDAPVRFVLNTHWHGDHTGGNESLGAAGALIVAHENVRRRLNPEQVRDLVGRGQQAPPAALPVITFSDELTFYWNSEALRVVHVAHAHTDGDAIILFERANAVHMGDVFFNGRYPFIDRESGGSVQGIIAAVDAVLGMVRPDTRIIPGHGAMGGPAELRAYRDMLVTVRDRVITRIGRGMSEDEVVAANPTADLDAAWGQNAERFVRAVYQSLA